LLATRTKSEFLDILESFDKDVKTVVFIHILRDKVSGMIREDFEYFILLLKFDYAFHKREKKE